MPESVHVGIALEFHYEYSRMLMRGIVSYARPDHPWVFHLLGECAQKCRKHPQIGRLDGVIGAFASEELAEVFRERGLSCVNVSCRSSTATMPRVGADNMGIGKLAARHFLDRGFSHFAFIDSFEPQQQGTDRERGFAEELAGAGLEYSSLTQWLRAHGSGGMDKQEVIRQWISGLPRPLAIFAVCDAVAWPLLEICRDLGVAVPESVAIVSVDNDPMICLLTSPTLSSVAIPAERIGYEAAFLLDRLMARQPVPEKPLLIPAKDVVARQSSDTLAMPDPELASAVRYIRQHAGNRIGVRDVVQATRVARRSLERKFRSVLGRSPLEEIRRARLDRVRELLINTDLSMPVIAQRSGFDSAVRLTTVFREATGMTPTHFRRQYRMADSESFMEEEGEIVETDGEAERNEAESDRAVGTS